MFHNNTAVYIMFLCINAIPLLHTKKYTFVQFLHGLCTYSSFHLRQTINDLLCILYTKEVYSYLNHYCEKGNIIDVMFLEVLIYFS